MNLNTLQAMEQNSYAIIRGTEYNEWRVYKKQRTRVYAIAEYYEDDLEKDLRVFTKNGQVKYSEVLPFNHVLSISKNIHSGYFKCETITYEELILMLL